MWDLDTLNYLNERAVLAHQMAVARAKEEVAQQPYTAPIFPLAILSRRLLTGPPSLVALIDLMENTETVQEFIELVREYLPDHEADIVSCDIDGRIARFVLHFSERYFPLAETADWDDMTLADFLHHIPVELMGFTYEDYHEFQDYRPGYILMLSVVDSPFYDPDEGGRVAIQEAVSELIGRGVMDLLPSEAWTTEQLHEKLDDTKYAGVATFADWVNAETGCLQLDANYEDYGPEDWSRRVIGDLTEQYPRIGEIWDKIFNIATWLEEDLNRNFREFIYYMTDNEDAFIVPKEQIPLPLD